MVLIGTGMTTLYQLLKAVWAENLSGGTSLQIQQFFQFGRERSLQVGSIVTMEIDLEKRTTGLRLYDPRLEDDQDQGLDSLAQQSASNSFRSSQIIKDIEEREEELAEEKDSTQEKWILRPTSLPSDLKKIYSAGGIELVGPKIFVHFYPNSTSDSLIFQFDRKNRAYLFLSRYNIPAIFLDNLETIDNYLEALRP